MTTEHIMAPHQIDRAFIIVEALAYGGLAAAIAHPGWPWYVATPIYLAAGTAVLLAARVLHAHLIADR
jgi:hypothetical protein